MIDRCKNADHDGEFDLLSGAAGTIVGLIVLSDLVGDSSLLNIAETFGRSLCQRGERTDAGTSWRSLRFPTMRNLTGFSHGTAGVAFALLEPFSATGNPEFGRCAEEAFQYERKWFDRKVQNWHDFRGSFDGRRQRFRDRQHATSWCHGAPGIALSRLRAYQVTGSAMARVDALVAARTTQLWIETSLATGMGNFSLCHGLAGNAEVLREAFRIIGAGVTVESQAAERVAEYGIRTYRRCRGGWPCGAHRSTPNLMLGLAGIGYFYLSTGGQSPPSVLLLRREEWRTPAML
jgi:lantibiotic modifying enzyme